MSEINEFARDLVIREIQIYKDNKSKVFDMTQPLSTLLCCAIIIFSDYKEKFGSDSLIKEMAENDKNHRQSLLSYIERIYKGETNLRLRLAKYYKDKKEENDKKIGFLNEDYKEYEVFFHDLRNEFAHLIETNHSKMTPNKDGDFNEVTIENCKSEVKLTKDNIIDLIELIYERIDRKE